LSTQGHEQTLATEPAKLLAPQGELASFIGAVTPYKELIVLVIALVSATIFLRDYFATKLEVGVLRCEMLIQVGLSATQAQLRDIDGRILNVQRLAIPDDVPPARQRELGFELRALEAERQRSQSHLDTAEGQIKSNACQHDAEG
jgi:hypothetical protein